MSYEGPTRYLPCDIDPPSSRKSIDDATPEEWDALKSGVTAKEKIDPRKPAFSKQVGGKHYKDMKVQPIEFIMANNLPYCEANAIKYICRHSLKGGVEDINKAIHYLELLKETKYG